MSVGIPGGWGGCENEYVGGRVACITKLEKQDALVS